MTKDKQTQYEARLVSGMLKHGRPTHYDLMKYCSDYFWDNYDRVFFAGEEEAQDILQETHIKLWENIENGRISVNDGRLMGTDGLPLRSSLRTYFMGIAKLKYLEYVRSNPGRNVGIEGFMKVNGDDRQTLDFNYVLYGDDEHTQKDIIADVISKMSSNCCQILTKYYYENKSFDTILAEIDSMSTKDVLKSTKTRCMKTLKERAHEIYNRYVKGL